MRKRLTALFISLAVLSASWAGTIVNDDFTGYTSGADLAGQGDWVQSSAPGVDAAYGAFYINNGTADTASAPRPDADNSWYAYLNGTEAGNDGNDEWAGSMDFTINFNTNVWRHGGLYRMGMATTATNYLVGSSNDVFIAIETEWPNHFEISTFDAAGVQQLIMPAIDHLDFGMDKSADDMDSDPMRLTWTVRKTTTPGWYGVTASIQNLTTASNFVGSMTYVQLDGIYADSDPVYMMGHHKGATWTKDLPVGFFGRKHIAVDSLSLVRSTGNPPVLTKPVAVAVGGNGYIDLSWGVVPDAEDYDILRSDTVDGTYSLVTGGSGVAGLTFTDSGLAAGQEYFYKVVANATGAASVESDPVSALSAAPQTGTYIDIDFQTGFSDGDLAGQNSWKAISGFPAEAFTVDTSDTGSAAATSQIGNAHTNVVLHSLVTSNSVNDQWSGTIDFTLNAEPADGTYKTKTYLDVDGITVITNTQQVAQNIGTRTRVGFTFGITADDESFLQGPASPVIQIVENWGHSIQVGFAMWNNDANRMLELSAEDLGWDPTWDTAAASNGPIFETLPIELDYTIRKTAVLNGYSCKISATIDGTVYEGPWVYTSDDETHVWMMPDETYGETFVQFGLGVSSPENDQVIYPKIDSLTVTHTANSPVPAAPPVITEIKRDAGGVTPGLILDWVGSGEQTNYTVYRAEAPGGPYTEVYSYYETGHSGTFTDTGLTDKYTYFYVVSAGYPGAVESPYSGEEHLRALGQSEHIRFGNYENWFLNNMDMALTPVVTNSAGTIKFWESNGINGSTIRSEDAGFLVEGLMTHYPKLVLQTPVALADPVKMQNRTQDVLDMQPAIGSSILIYSEGLAFDADNGALSFESKKSGNWANDRRLAIRSGANWYASQTLVGGSVVHTIADIRNEYWSPFTMATADSASLMAVSGTWTLGSELDLSQINAVGVLVESTEATFWFEGYKTTYGTVITAFDLWCDDYEIYNADAVKTLDYDSDGKNNSYEWGLGGDPTDDTDIGITDFYGWLEGGSLMYVYPRLKSGDRPAYTIMSGFDLILGLGDELAEGVDYTEVSSGGDWNQWNADFEAVTNAIPAGADAAFFKVDVQ